MTYKNKKQIETFLTSMNVEKDFIKGHDIGREMLLAGEDKKLAKLFASLAGLAQQFDQGKMEGYEKFRKMVLKRMEEMPEHPFDERDFRFQLKQMDEVIEKHRNGIFSSVENDTDKVALFLRLKNE